jgi:carboxymethylenebutenolidase
MMRTETLQFETAGGATKAFVAMPDNTDNAKTVIVIHEWWGLNEQIKNTAQRYAEEGFIAIAPDLYRGVLATNADEASKLMHGLAIEDGLNTIESAIAKARETFGTSHFGITGYCMGGTFTLRAACEIEGISAAVPYYGDIPEDEVLQKLSVPVVFVSGIRDQWINPEKVAGLEASADKFGLEVDSLKYDADHAFCNSTRPEVYHREAAEDAWAKTVGFFNDKL